MSFQNKIREIAPTHARPLKSAIFPDHPHPTMLVEGGQEPGDGHGWKSVEIRKNKKKVFRRGRYKANQREFYQVGHENQRLSFEELLSFDGQLSGQSFVTGLPAKILLGPNDEGRRSVSPQRGWTAPTGGPLHSMARQCAPFSRSDSASDRNQQPNPYP